MVARGLHRNSKKSNVSVRDYIIRTDFNETMHLFSVSSIEMIAECMILAILKELPPYCFPRNRPDLKILLNEYSASVIQELERGFPRVAIQDYNFSGAAREILRFEPTNAFDAFPFVARKAKILIKTGRLHEQVATDMISEVLHKLQPFFAADALATEVQEMFPFILADVLEALYKSNQDFSGYLTSGDENDLYERMANMLKDFPVQNVLVGIGRLLVKMINTKS